MTDSSFAFIMPRRNPVCWIFGMLLLSSCANEPVSKPPMRTAAPKVQAQKPPTEAVRSYGLGDSQDARHMLNAETLIQSGDGQTALRELDLINYANLSSEQRGKFNLLAAQIALSMGEAENALNKLEIIRPTLLTDADKINYYQSLAFAQTLTGNILAGVSARVRLGGLLIDPKKQHENIITILDMLGNATPESLNAPPTSGNNQFNGWIALAKILKQRGQTGADIDGQIRQWRQTYPNHPANAEFLQSYLTGEPTITEAAGNEPAPALASGPGIAVILPSSGAYAQAAKAVRDGLQVAHRLAAMSSPQPNLKFYDSEQGAIADIYKQAVADGAKQVIGPLVKEQVQALADYAELTVPVLALNAVENLNKANLYQFGLGPIDDAEQLALKARRDGRQTAMLLMPNNPQGQRVGNYLRTAWQNNGGIITRVQDYDPKQHNIGAALKDMLSAPGDANAAKLPQTIFLSANSELGHEFAEQLKYFLDRDLAVYAMPNIYRGRPSPAQDAELGKITFCDIPWLFTEIYSGMLSQEALKNTWQAYNESQMRLLALGLDAYNLINQLDQLKTSGYSGATGRLSLTSENRVARKLVCAQFKGGAPVPSGFIE